MGRLAPIEYALGDAGHRYAYRRSRWNNLSVEQPQVMRGTFRWLPPDEGGRLPIQGTRYAATARLGTEPPSEDWSIVIDGIAPGAVESEVEARWLVWPNVDLAVTSGSVLQVLEGPRVVARLEVREVRSEDA